MSRWDWDDAHLIDVLYDLHDDDVNFGYRFLTAELEFAHGVGENPVRRLCRIAGIAGIHTGSGAMLGPSAPRPMTASRRS